MQLDRAQFLREGYLILRNVVPPDQLEALRTTSELLVERQKLVWARQRQEGDPPGGQWEASNQPRLLVQRQTDLIDA